MRNFKIIIFINTIISIVCLYLFFLDGGGLNYGGVLLLAIPIAGYYFVSTKKVTNGIRSLKKINIGVLVDIVCNSILNIVIIYHSYAKNIFLILTATIIVYILYTIYGILKLNSSIVEF